MPKKVERRVNEQIKAEKVLLIDNTGDNKGITTKEKALTEAREKGLDLVMMTADADLPVCKLMDYGKYLYREKKKNKKERKKQKQTLKEMKFYPKIDDHDYKTKLRHIRRFLKENNPVRIQIWMRGREKLHPELAEELVQRIIGDTLDIAKIQGEPEPSTHRYQFQLMPVGGIDAQT